MLNPQQQAVVNHSGGPLLVLACPGSGKTKCIISRIIKLIEEDNVPQSKILAITFTNKAAKEMNERLAKAGYKHVLLCTFHSLCVKILRKCGQLIGFKPHFTIVDQSYQLSLIRKILKSKGFDPKEFKTSPEYLAKILEDKKNKFISDDEFRGTLPPELMEVLDEYQKTLKLSNSMDFSDLIYYTVKIFKEYPTIVDYYSSKYQHLLVDEMQDTNYVQLLLIQLLCSKHNNVIAVGDIDQCLYSWRSATIDNVLKFDQYFPGYSTIKLETNYRSTQEIIDLSLKLIANNKQRFDVIPNSHKGSSGKKVLLLKTANPEQESEEIADIIQSLRHRGVEPNEIAILCRTNSQTRSFEECFRRREIPYALIGSYSFYDRKEVKTALAYMKFISNPDDVLAFEEAISTPSRGVGPAALLKILEFAEAQKITFYEACKRIEEIKVQGKVKISIRNFLEFLEIYDRNDPSNTLKLVFDQVGYLPFLKETDQDKNEYREDNVKELLRSFHNYCLRKSNPSIDQYLQEISLISTSDQESDINSVNLMTCHAAKGLEFHSVFVPGMEENIFPHHRSLKDNSVEEERRVCYVAITRAKENLYLSCSDIRLENNRFCGTIPSRFLVEMGLIDRNL